MIISSITEFKLATKSYALHLVLPPNVGGSFYTYSVTLLMSPLRMYKRIDTPKLSQDIQKLRLNYVCVKGTKVILTLFCNAAERGTRTPTIVTISGF